MNKYQEALDILSCLMSRKTEDDYTPFEYRKAQATLQELVDKATPTKPIWEFDDEPICPYCRSVLDGDEEHCEVCDQRIDWSDEE